MLPISIAAAANTATTLVTHTHTHTHIHTHTYHCFTVLALLADLCLPLSAGEDTFELHFRAAVGKEIGELLEKQAQLRKWKATLEISRADAHKSGGSMLCAANTPTTSTLCFFLHRPRAPGTRSSQMAFIPVPGPWVQQQKTRSSQRSTTSPPPVFEISTRNRFVTLCETERDCGEGGVGRRNALRGERVRRRAGKQWASE